MNETVVVTSDGNQKINPINRTDVTMSTQTPRKKGRYRNSFCKEKRAVRRSQKQFDMMDQTEMRLLDGRGRHLNTSGVSLSV